MDKKGPEFKEISNLDKIFWRLKVLVFESLGKNWGAIKLSLSSAAQRRNRQNFMDILQDNKVINLERDNNFFTAGKLKFYFSPKDKVGDFIVDFISIWGNDISFIRKNFIKSSAYYFEGPYENKHVFLESGDQVIDAGANLGLFAILASRKVGENGRIFAFEPIRETKELLLKNIRYNKKQNIKLIPQALGEDNFWSNFAIFDSLGDSSGYFKQASKQEKVEQISLDSFVQKNEVKRVNFIKADIEGMERDLLRGAERTIKKFKPKIAICLYHRPDDPRVLENIIKGFVPDYKIQKTRAKLFAWV